MDKDILKIQNKINSLITKRTNSRTQLTLQITQLKHNLQELRKEKSKEYVGKYYVKIFNGYSYTDEAEYPEDETDLEYDNTVYIFCRKVILKPKIKHVCDSFSFIVYKNGETKFEFESKTKMNLLNNDWKEITVNEYSNKINEIKNKMAELWTTNREVLIEKYL